MKSQSRTEQAVKLGKTVDDATFGRIIRGINKFDTLADFYDDPKASLEAIRELHQAGAVNQMQMAEMVEEGKISDNGKQLLENMLVGKAFESNPDAVRQLAEFPSMRRSVVFALAEVANNIKLGKDYTLESELAQAIALAYNARKSGIGAGKMVSQFARQTNLFAFDEGATVADYTNATVMMLADCMNDSRVSQLKKVLAIYNDMAAASAAGQYDIFSGGVKTKEEILKDVLNTLNYGTEQEQQAALAGATERRKEAASVSEDGVAVGGDEGSGRAGGIAGSDEKQQGDIPTPYRLSDEIDENGLPFVLASDGQIEFGRITAETGLTEAPILLSEGMITDPTTKAGYGLVHIEARHGEQIRKAGYGSVVEFVEDVAKNWEVIRQGKSRDGNTTYMLQLTDKHDNTLMVELSGDGTYWNINTAGIFKISYGANRRVVYDRHTTDNQPAETDGASLEGEQSGTTPSTRMNAPTQASEISDGKDTKKSGNSKKTEGNNQKKIDFQQIESADDVSKLQAEARAKLQERFDRNDKELHDLAVSEVYGRRGMIGKNPKPRPVTVHEFVADVLASGEMKITPESFRKETGYGKEEQKRYFYLIAGKEKGGMSIGKAAEIMSDLWADETYDNVAVPSDYRVNAIDMINIMLEVLQEGRLKSYVRRRMEDEIADEEHRNRYYRDLEYRERYGMGYDEWCAAEVAMLEDIIERSKMFTDEILSRIFAYENEADVEPLNNNINGRYAETGNQEKSSGGGQQDGRGVESVEPRPGGGTVERSGNILQGTRTTEEPGTPKSKEQELVRGSQHHNQGTDTHEAVQGTAPRGEVKDEEPLSVADVQGEAGRKRPATRRTEEATKERQQKAEGEDVLPVGEVSKAVRDAAVETMKDMGIDVSVDEEEGQRVLDMVNGTATMSMGKKKTASETRKLNSPEGEKAYVTEISDAESGAKILNNLDTLAKKYEERGNRLRNILNDIAESIDAESDGSSSRYATIRAKNGRIITIRLSNHNASVRNFDNRGEEEGVSIVVAGTPNNGIENGGTAHVVEWFYRAQDLRSADGKPLVDIIRSVKQMMYSGEYKDTTGLAVRQEVNADDLRQMKVYHGSGADFDRFDHSHMGEGEGAQAYGWGSYVTDVEGIGRTYARAKEDPKSTENEIVNKLVENSINRFNGDRQAALKEWRDLLEEEWSDKKRVKKAIKVLETGKKLPVKKAYRYLYTVEIPDDNGRNHLRWDKVVANEIIDRLREGLEDKYGEDVVWNANLKYGQTTQQLYKKLSSTLGSAQEASEFLHRAGYTGIKYPTDYRRDSSDKGTYNYVVFDEGDLKITDKAKFFRTQDGVAYGFTLGGKVYIDPRIATSETPVHEYMHLWAQGVRRTNPKAWEDIKREFAADKDLVDWVRRRYPEIEDEDTLMEEVFAHYSGRSGAERLEADMKAAMDAEPSLTMKARVATVFHKLRELLNRFWDVARDMFAGKDVNLRKMSREDIADMAMGDFLGGFNPNKATPKGAATQQMLRMQEAGDVFYSNAEKAVEGVKQEKATAEQWRAMVQKAGGLKAGEDKWLGLGDWLEERKGQTLTKQEVLDYIRENKVQVEEVGYREGLSKEGEAALKSYQEEYRQLYDAALEEKGRMEGDDGEFARLEEKMLSKYGEGFAYKLEGEDLAAWNEMKDRYERVKEPDEAAVAGMVEMYGDDFEMAFRAEGADLLIEEDWYGMSDAAKYFLKGENDINETRLTYTTEGLENKREIALTVPTVEPWNEGDEIHFGDAGGGRAVAWVRFGETTDKDGNRVLVIDEIQSKRHQEGREKGYKDSVLDAKIKRMIELEAKMYSEEGITNEEYEELSRLRAEGVGRASMGVPDAPFEKNWHELAMKRMLRYAAENGFDKVAWTTGEQQAERYNIGSVVVRIDVSDWTSIEDDREAGEYGMPSYGEESRVLNIIPKKRNDMHSTMYTVARDGRILKGEGDAKTLAELVGKEMSEKLLTTDESAISGEGLRIGGEGMKGFYDHMLPRFMDKYGKKWGVKTKDVGLQLPRESDRVMHSVDVTDEMRKSVLEEGQPMFMREKWNNSGYTIRENGTRVSRRGLAAEEEGRYPAGTFRQKNHMPKSVFDVLEEIGVVANNGEWHHTGKSLKKTYYYGWSDDADAVAYKAHKSEIDKICKESKLAEYLVDAYEDFKDLIGTPAFDSKKYDEEVARRHEGRNRERLRMKEALLAYLPSIREKNVRNANRRFNEELQQQIDGTLPKGHVYRMGKPGTVLLSTGIADAPIELKAERLAEKATGYNHDFELSEVSGLVEAINNPVAVFAYGDKGKAQNIVVEIQHDGKNFIVGLSIRPTVGNRVLEINSIRNVFPKDNAEWLNWISQGKLLYADKKRIQDLIDQQRTNLADVDYLDLDSIAKIVNNFENPTTLHENNLQDAENNGVLFRKGEIATAEGSDPKAEKQHDEKSEEDGEGVRYRMVEDEEEIEALERGEKETGYRNVVLNEDGTLGSPMAGTLGSKGNGKVRTSGFEFGRWERSEENPGMATEGGKIDLGKPDGLGTVGSVDYNPYIHIRPTKLNKQFTQAWKRGNLVYVETAYPASELTSGYQAEKAKKSVGRHDWNGGELILSRWDKPTRIVPWEEVADDWAAEYKDGGVTFDIVPPALLPHLVERGIEILPPKKSAGAECKEAYNTFKETGESPIEGVSDERLAEVNAHYEKRQREEDAEAEKVKLNQIVSTDGKTAQKAAIEWWLENVGGERTYEKEVGRGAIDKTSIKDSLGHGYSQKKLDAITSLANGFEKAVYIGSLSDFEGNGVTNHFFAYPIEYGGERNYVVCRAREDINKNRLYVHEVYVADEMKKGNSLQTAASARTDELKRRGISLYRDILSNVLNSVAKV